MEAKPDSCVLVIFGASGDLTHRKLGPALYHLAKGERLPEGLAIVGYSRSPLTDEQLRERLREGIQEFSGDGRLEPAVWEGFGAALSHVQGGYDGGDGGFARLKERMESLRRERGIAPNVLFYLATPPATYVPIVRALGAAGLVHPAGEGAPGWTRIVIEKPFGVDLESARELNREVLAVFDESQVYRIDHYLGKETVQNILMLRFANAIFEPLWNHKYIDHVQITAAEAIGVEDRGGYYDRAGALRDMIQNHLLQLLTLVGMEPPAAFDADAVRDEKSKVLRCIRRLESDPAGEVVRGQYAAGFSEGKPVPGYRAEKGVEPHSQTETYVALRLWLDNWRWAGVPFYLRTGKRLPRRVSEIAIAFREVPHALFRGSGDVEANLLVMRIQPNEGISLRFEAKSPGLGIHLRPVRMDFSYGETFGEEAPSAYETLLLDVLRGDGTLFTRGDEVLEAWQLLAPLQSHWAAGEQPSALYEAGSWGPAEADALIAPRQWRQP